MNFNEKYNTIKRMYKKAFIANDVKNLAKWSKRANDLYRDCWFNNEMLGTYERETVLFLIATHEDLYSIRFESFIGICAIHKALGID